MQLPIRLPAEDGPNAVDPLAREWLVANGLGGYASGTTSGACTRRYHGLLIAALPAPMGRYVMLDNLSAQVTAPDGAVTFLDLDDLGPNAVRPANFSRCDFSLEGGLPVWRYQIGRHRIEKRIFLPRLQNTVCVLYRLLEGTGPLRLTLRPAMHFRRHDSPVRPDGREYTTKTEHSRFEIHSEDLPSLRIRVVGPDAAAHDEGGRTWSVYYGTEHARGYDYMGCVWSPGRLEAILPMGHDVTVLASTAAWDVFEDVDHHTLWAAEVHRREHLLASAVPSARQGLGAELVLAADQFLFQPTTRPADAALAAAAGDQLRTVIAGYHWFTDWGRDTMISLEGLMILTGRTGDARNVLKTFARYERDGLIPNLFPEGEREGLYHTADATLWFFHALNAYWQATRDRETLDLLLPVLHGIVEWHTRGTHFGIGVDPADGLLRQGAEGYQLTWMDAKVDGWVVTPRRGKAVEINALWYNALRLLEGWDIETGDHAAASRLCEQAARVRASFNERFWFENGGYLYDVVDGEHGGPRGIDAAFRPNQILAMSLDHPVLAAERWPTIFDQVRERLLTPYGLRTLDPKHPDYKPTYDGNLFVRDAAYHQGTVWPWLLGPFVNAWLRVHPDEKAAIRTYLEPLADHVGEAGIGSVSEIFDAEAPYHPRGCIAQAWSVSELLRCWVLVND